MSEYDGVKTTDLPRSTTKPELDLRHCDLLLIAPDREYRLSIEELIRYIKSQL